MYHRQTRQYLARRKFLICTQEIYFNYSGTRANFYTGSSVYDLSFNFVCSGLNFIHSQNSLDIRN